MKQIFNPAISVEDMNGALSVFRAPVPVEDKPAAKRRRRKSSGRGGVPPWRTVAGFEVRNGIPFPSVKRPKTKKLCKWEILYNDMKTGECVVMDRKEAGAFQVWAIYHKLTVSVRKVDGEILVFKMRKKPAKRKQKAK